LKKLILYRKSRLKKFIYFTEMGRKFYYYHKDSGLEVDFVIRYNGECTLVEVKAASQCKKHKNYTEAS